MHRSIRCLFLLVLSALSGACQREAPAVLTRAPEKATPITMATVRAGVVEVVEEAIGQVVSKATPEIAAEVAGRVAEVRVEAGRSVAAGTLLAVLDDRDFRIALHKAEAEGKRLEALIQRQQRELDRLHSLLPHNFVTPTQVEQAEADLRALQEELAASRADREVAEQNLRRARIVAPIGGQVEQRMVAVGDFVQVGEPLFRLAVKNRLQIEVPFPETVAAGLRRGLPVELRSPAAPDQPVRAEITEIRPLIGSGNRALQTLVELDNPGDWKPGASVRARVILAVHEGALSIPEKSVVARPAGSVAYVVEGTQVRQRVIETGLRRHGSVEVLKGLAAGEQVAVDGAEFLTDGALVQVTEVGR